MDVSFSSSLLSNDFNKDHVITTTCPSDECAVSDEEDGGRRQMAAVSVAACFSGRSAEFVIYFDSLNDSGI